MLKCPWHNKRKVNISKSNKFFIVEFHLFVNKSEKSILDKERLNLSLNKGEYKVEPSFIG